jgi:glutamate-1-semialdehyde 2,1-aminomutase
MAAAIATMETLQARENEIYSGLESLGAQLQIGLEELFAEAQIEAVVCRQSSAWCVYFMDHAPRDWHDLAQNHDMERDLKFRRALIERGIYLFPLPTKQGSISAAHTQEDIETDARRSARSRANVGNRGTQ